MCRWFWTAFFFFSFHFLFIVLFFVTIALVLFARFDSSILMCALGCSLECAYTATIPSPSHNGNAIQRLVYSICTYITIFLINLLKCMRINNTKYSLNGDVIVRSVHCKRALCLVCLFFAFTDIWMSVGK